MIVDYHVFTKVKKKQGKITFSFLWLAYLKVATLTLDRATEDSKYKTDSDLQGKGRDFRIKISVTDLKSLATNITSIHNVTNHNFHLHAVFIHYSATTQNEETTL